MSSSYRSSGSGFDLAWLSCFLSASVSSVYLVLYVEKCLITYFSLPFSVQSLWDWPLTWKTIILHCWLGHLTCKIVSKMTYKFLMCRVSKPYNTNRLSIDDDMPSGQTAAACRTLISHQHDSTRHHFSIPILNYVYFLLWHHGPMWWRFVSRQCAKRYSVSIHLDSDKSVNDKH